MTRLQLILGLTLTLAITLAAGAMHGRLSERWGGSDAAKRAAATLESLPAEFGSWRLDQSKPLGQIEVDQLQPYGYVNRTYVHLDSGQKVSFFVLVGPVGPTAVHTPEICYSSRNYTITQPKEPTSLRADGHGTDQFWAMTFRSNSLEGGLLRVYYGWSDGTSWEASDDGRYKYVGLPFLYKIQLAAFLPRNADLKKEDACRLFLNDLLPALQAHMVPAKI
jgi:hypothetical protein